MLENLNLYRFIGILCTVGLFLSLAGFVCRLVDSVTVLFLSLCFCLCCFCCFSVCLFVCLFVCSFVRFCEVLFDSVCLPCFCTSLVSALDFSSFTFLRVFVRLRSFSLWPFYRASVRVHVRGFLRFF